MLHISTTVEMSNRLDVLHNERFKNIQSVYYWLNVACGKIPGWHNCQETFLVANILCVRAGA